jgi:hypothetical protein
MLDADANGQAVFTVRHSDTTELPS